MAHTRQRPAAALTRSRLLQALQRDLEQDTWPRLQMALLVALTGAAGLLASFLLLQAGIKPMWLRYPLALALAYLVFLALLWLWLRTRAEDYLDLPTPSGEWNPGSASAPSGPGLPVPGGGGDFAGAGASAGFDGSAQAAPLDASPGVSDLSIGDSKILDAMPDADEWAIPLVVIALAAGMAASAFFIVYAAPALLAELLLDALLAAGLYRRLRGIGESPHWVRTAVRRTSLPFAALAVFLALCGAGMQVYAPDAHSLGEVLHHATRQP